MIPDPSPPFEFGVSGAVRERIGRMLARAATRGIRPEVERSVAFILDHLVMEPRTWGDPVWNLRNAEQVTYHGRHDRLLAVYTVHERVPIVFLWQIVPQEGHPLFGENFDAP